ncbi:hypothetical protein DF185_23315, partial [Marinifilum breve]
CYEVNSLQIVEMKGRIELKDIIEFFKEILETNFLSSQIQILEDATLAEFAYDIEDSNHIKNLFELQKQRYPVVKHAMIRNTPVQTAYGIMLEDMTNCSNYYPKVFSTKQGALQWLLSDQL